MPRDFQTFWAALDKTKPHHVTATVAAVVSAAVALGGSYVMRPAQQVVTPSGKVSTTSWGELSQREVNALDSLLKLIPVELRSEVAIFCGNRDCEDIALDFDNAFESAGWKSAVERPLVDGNTGIHVGPPGPKAHTLADAIRAATGGRIVPEMLPASVDNAGRLVLVISRKPK